MQPLQRDIEIIATLLTQLKQSQSLTEFETIKLPFELVQAMLPLWNSFDSQTLQNLANTDVDALEAWAIALSQTLNTQLETLDSWLPHLTTLPIPVTLKQKINDRIKSIAQTINNKSELLSSSKQLLQLEEELYEKAQEFEALKNKVKNLQVIKNELQDTNLEKLQQDILIKSTTLKPQYIILKDLQQKKADLDEQINALQLQQTTLSEEINYWQSRQNRLENNITSSVSELITLTQSQRQRLSEALSQELGALEAQQQSYHQVQQQLQKAKEDFQKYQTETQETLMTINTHYQHNQELATLLPINCEKVNSLIENIKQTLTEIDKELADAHRKHEQTQQRKPIFF
ncbi:hypothetical protein NIES2101_34040 [Calothrix sp. HK-06]|nr:hypothetical protein NIES2101_34040 [Calothrix sp. HK-06]